MKKVIIGVLVVLAAVGVVGGCFLLMNSTSSKEPTPTPIVLAEKVVIGEEVSINTLKEYEIDGTKDTFKITSDVKWEVPDAPEGSTVSFAISIPYTIKTEKKEYTGTYILGDNSTNKLDEKCPYDVLVTNLTSDGVVTLKVTKK